MIKKDCLMQLSLEDIKNNIDSFKAKTVELALSAVVHPDAQYLEPRELKTLTDVMLNIEDSYKNKTDEGETARKINRLLEKYSSDGEPNIPQHTNSLPTTTSKVIIDV